MISKEKITFSALENLALFLTKISKFYSKLKLMLVVNQNQNKS
jgi:hypothetical protein